MPEESVTNAEPQVSDFITVKGGPVPVPDPNPVNSALRTEFGGDFDKLAKSYDELRSKFSGDLGTVKSTMSSFEQKLAQIDQINTTLQALQANLAPRAPEPPPVQTQGQAQSHEPELIPDAALYDTRMLTTSVDQLIQNRLKGAMPQTNPQFEQLLQKVEQLSQNYNPQSFETKLNEMMEERLTRMTLDNEKALLLREHNQDTVDLAGYLAYKNGKSSYIEGMELVKQKYPSLIAPKMPERPDLPMEMLSSASSVDNGTNSLHRQYEGVMGIKSPSQMLMAIK